MTPCRHHLSKVGEKIQNLGHGVRKQGTLCTARDDIMLATTAKREITQDRIIMWQLHGTARGVLLSGGKGYQLDSQEYHQGNGHRIYSAVASQQHPDDFRDMPFGPKHFPMRNEAKPHLKCGACRSERWGLNRVISSWNETAANEPARTKSQLWEGCKALPTAASSGVMSMATKMGGTIERKLWSLKD
ncbi:hypothetical protein EYF80_031512 [Liparis tanakae]|uniref:Uncharacterized protein n=1 Tax=Liparis tanakae TaxID=230148 RepID=A0A4Z2H058_9TELE|nr:hypothetical protein EYF80_031512 [Liparis tanakae]